MRKRICISLLACFLLSTLFVQAFAAEAEIPRVIDTADLLSAEEERLLENSIEQLRGSYELDIVIVTVWDLEGKTVQEYADDYYDDNHFGYGEDASGILLLLAMDTREWYMSTCGDAIYIFTDYGLDQMGNAIVPYLSEGDYYEAFDNWIHDIPYYCDSYRSGSSIDGYVPPDAYTPEGGDQIVYPEYSQDTTTRDNLISAIAGLIVAAVVVLIMRSRMNTARLQTNAADYMQNNSFRLTSRSDLYLYSRVTKTPKPQNNSGGGSSVHRSSGGRSHGGRGGRF